MNYRSVADMSRQVAAWTHKLPSDLDLIVGIPRSGLLVANLLALCTNLPMTDVDGLLQGRLLSTGPRYEGDLGDLTSRTLDVLVVDDSVWSGQQMQEVKERIAAAALPHRIRYAAVYVRPGSQHHVDFVGELLSTPRVFEWNIVNHNYLSETCIDIDGVLCRDPTEAENDDGACYEEFVSTVPPLITPSKKVGWVVTSRLEKYRPLTEAWLERYGVEYGELIMLDLPSKEARLAAGSHATFKADVYKATGASLFIESALWQASEIANRVGRPVFCMDERQMIWPGHELGQAPRSIQRLWWLLSRTRSKVLSRLSPAMANALGNLVADPIR